MNYIHISH